MTEPLIIELSSPGRCAVSLPKLDVPQAAELPDEWLRDDLALPEVSERDLVSHYVRLSQLNYAVDIGFYPLGSCTMKYNPRINEDTARLEGFAASHPLQPAVLTQGSLELLCRLQDALAALTGLEGVSLQPAAGAQGELAGVLMIRAYHQARGDTARKVMLIPDTAHGTNPASTAMAGYEAVEVASDARGNVDLDDLYSKLGPQVAGIMLTNPSTLGLFEERILEVTAAVHAAGALVYGDGANFNALMGKVRPAELGIDIMHFNLHKTFSTPHGGGGPGSGPVAVRSDLAPFLPGPIAVRDENSYVLHMPKHSIGAIKAFYGQFSILVRAYTYIRMLGAEGLRDAAESAVLAANYLQAKLRGTLPLPYERTCMHECVFEGRIKGAEDVRALDISKRMIDYGIHPPTNYFPLIVPEALMVEPTETESLATLDRFVEIVQSIVAEAHSNPALLREAPHNAPVGRLDEVQAARRLILSWHDKG
ncbi:MAG: aminomethyl-transferring glycine dehydrogenase subunit GcvPB [Chloroflexi bacterium]|nr:aminomethyl-transferring glycine dehydrogenase subunit GcvPB [Chloroflexota bacterium]